MVVGVSGIYSDMLKVSPWSKGHPMGRANVCLVIVFAIAASIYLHPALVEILMFSPLSSLAKTVTEDTSLEGWSRSSCVAPSETKSTRTFLKPYILLVHIHTTPHS